MRFPLALIAVFALTSAAHAGLTVRTQTEGRLRTVAIEGNRMCIDNADKAGRTEIFDGDKKVFITVDPRKRTYAEMTEADMRKAGERMRQQMEKMRAEAEKQISSLPPEQRKEMEKMMAATGGGGMLATNLPEEKFQPTGQRKTIAGMVCQLYRVTREGWYEHEECLIPWGSQVKREDLKVLESFSDFMSSAFSGQDRVRGQLVYTEMMRAPGFPAQIVDLGEGRQVQEELKILSRGGVPPEKFKPPAGFTKVSADEMGTGFLGLEPERKPAPRARPDLNEEKGDEKDEDDKD